MKVFEFPNLCCVKCGCALWPERLHGMKQYLVKHDQSISCSEMTKIGVITTREVEIRELEATEI